MEKACTVCGIIKPLADYYFQRVAKNQLHSQCKDCYKAKRKKFAVEHYAKYGDAYRERARIRKRRMKRQRQDQLYAYLAGKSCLHCGVSDIRVLGFDHINPSTKKFTIARGVCGAYAWDIILAEIAKCRILCSNCHRIRTAEQQNWRKMAPWPSG